jgi:hypothetical protein
MLEELRSLEFWVTIIIGGLLLGFAFVLTDLRVQLATVGIYVTLLLGLVMATLIRVVSVDVAMSEAYEISQKIAQNPNVKEFYDSTIQPFCEIFAVKDDVFIDLVKSRLNEFRLQLATEFAMGTISFRAEAWRVPYRNILNQPDMKVYKSVAWVKSEDYWQDQTGKSSIQFNYELIKSGKEIERIFIVRDSVWNSSKIRNWIREQKDKGIKIAVAREGLIPVEEDLMYDMGIYGERAVGYQNLDENCRTTSFQLHFNKSRVEKANELFEKLKMHTLTLNELESYLKTPSN